MSESELWNAYGKDAMAVRDNGDAQLEVTRRGWRITRVELRLGAGEPVDLTGACKRLEAAWEPGGPQPVRLELVARVRITDEPEPER